MISRTRTPNLAARLGRWSANHWKTATFGWLTLVLVAFAVGGAVGTKNVDPNTAGPGESGRMDRILDAGFKQPAGESVLADARRDSRRGRRRDGRHGRVEGPAGPDEGEAAARRRLRAPVRVLLDAGRLPVDRRRSQGGPAQPALRRRRVRRAGARLPARRRQEPARLQQHGGDRPGG